MKYGLFHLHMPFCMRVPYARTFLSSGLNKKVGRRHASRMVSILAVLLCAAALTGIAHRQVRQPMVWSALRVEGALLVLSRTGPSLVLWGWQFLFHFADQGIEGLTRDGDHLPFLGNRDRGRHGPHVEASAFALITEGALVLLEHLCVLNREVPFQERADHLQIHCRLQWFRGLGHRLPPFPRLLVGCAARVPDTRCWPARRGPPRGRHTDGPAQAGAPVAGIAGSTDVAPQQGRPERLG